MRECSRSSGVMPPSPVVVDGPDLGGAAPERLLGRARQGAEAHAGDRDRDVQVHAARARSACRSPRRSRTARGSPRADSATRSRRGTAGRRSAARGAWRRSRGCRTSPRARPAGSRRSTLRSNVADSRRPGCQPFARPVRQAATSQYAPEVVDVEVVEPARRSVAAEVGRVDVVDPGALEQLRAAARGARRASPSRRSRRRAPSTDPRTYSRASYSESPSDSPASPHTTRHPFWAMNAPMCPTEPRTTMSAPFSEIPHRAEASPWITSSPPRAARRRRLAGAALDDRPCPTSCSRPRRRRSCRARAPWRACSCRRSSSRRGLDLDFVAARRGRPRSRAARPGCAPRRARLRRPSRSVVQALVELADAVARQVERTAPPPGWPPGVDHHATSDAVPQL